jgi:hypothetical protein
MIMKRTLGEWFNEDLGWTQMAEQVSLNQDRPCNTTLSINHLRFTGNYTYQLI